MLLNMYFFLLISLYCILSFVISIRHTLSVLRIMNQAKKEESYLRDMVAMYEYTPTGAQYYLYLQNLYIKKKEAFDEYNIYIKNKFKFCAQHIILYALFWPYYFIHFFQQKKQQ